MSSDETFEAWDVQAGRETHGVGIGAGLGETQGGAGSIKGDKAFGEGGGYGGMSLGYPSGTHEGLSSVGIKVEASAGPLGERPAAVGGRNLGLVDGAEEAELMGSEATDEEFRLDDLGFQRIGTGAGIEHMFDYARWV
jgi:hypothetical protein